jgi:hypothetical protein
MSALEDISISSSCSFLWPLDSDAPCCVRLSAKIAKTRSTSVTWLTGVLEVAFEHRFELLLCHLVDELRQHEADPAATIRLDA